MIDAGGGLRITRSQLLAASVAALFVLLGTFALGFAAGVRRDVPDAPRPFVPVEGDLTELVQRVGSSDANSSEGLSYQDALKSNATPDTTPEEHPDAPSEAVAPPAPGDVAPLADAIPAGQFALECGRFGTETAARNAAADLRAVGVEAWVWTVRVDGEASWRVAIGGYATEDEAHAALSALGTSDGPAGALLGAASVVAIR